MITLHDYWRSSASYRVRIALGLAGVRWDCIPVNLLEGEHRDKAHLALNPQGLVPVLQIDGETMTQSLAIIEYLNETKGLRLLPGDPIGRAKVRSLAYAIAMDIHPVCNLGVAKYAVSQSNGGITMQGWMHHFIAQGLAAVEAILPGGDHCFGGQVTIADLCLLPQIYNARRWLVSLDDMPKIRQIEANLVRLPAFAAAHPDLAPKS